MSTSKLFSGILVGAAAGAVLGLLFAPDKGCETRKKIRDGADELVSNLKNKVGSLKQTVTDRYEDATQSADNMSSQKYS